MHLIASCEIPVGRRFSAPSPKLCQSLHPVERRGAEIGCIRTMNWGPCAAQRMNELAGQSLGGYLLEEEIGRGSMGMVYRGKQIALGREVAIKVLPRALARDASYVARFIREAQIIAGLNHPNIVQIYDFRISQASPNEAPFAYMAMNYVEGPTLSQYLCNTSHKRMFPSADDLLHIFTPICMAVDYAHEKGIIHRDIKPENILIHQEDSRLVITDFGIARALEPGVRVGKNGTNKAWCNAECGEECAGSRLIRVRRHERNDEQRIKVVAHIVRAREDGNDDAFGVVLAQFPNDIDFTVDPK